MAIISDEDFKIMRRWASTSPDYKHTWQEMGISKQELHATLQAVEDYSTASYNNRPAGSLRAAMEAAAGITLALEQSMAIWFSWSWWKGRDQHGGA